MKVAFTPIVVGTVTGTASLGQRLDLQVVWSSAMVPNNHGVCAIRNPEADACRPEGSIPLHNGFGRQVTALVRLPSRDATCNVKAFETGNLQITGARSLLEVRQAASAISATLGCSSPFDVRIRMVNANFRYVPAVSRKRLIEYISETRPGLYATFDPAIAAVAKIHFCFNTCDSSKLAAHAGMCCCISPCALASARNRSCFRCMAMIHRTGTVMLSGACMEEHISRAAELVKEIIQSYFDFLHSEHDAEERSKDGGNH